MAFIMAFTMGIHCTVAYRRSVVVTSSFAVNKLIVAFALSIAIASSVTVEPTFVGFKLAIA